ncbi:DUF928 domain-containing protein (plasmid) [Kovacikia minuta CCNUW1]|uniref:DUF928 domain-containing protein n=1 Tax=Kovacikia minuta TaxID=2931930 RepID=UPI001CCCB07B|nr:DUF928 domain-containing protein [Kovacikia minuta]UBF30746.1 DUF928 domain-containing protein [Kovacikia minuta CCNUW1]
MSSRESRAWQRIICYTLIGVLTGAVVNGAISPAPAQAQSILDRLRLLIFPPTDRGSASNRHRAAGARIRGKCSANNSESGMKDIVALIPKDNIGRTITANPTFWFYIPTFWSQASESSISDKPSQIKTGEFMLLNDRGEAVLKQPITVKLADQAGFSRFTLPTDPSLWVSGKSLEVGKRYNWFFSIVCDANQPATNPTVEGWVERLEAPANLKTQLQQVAPANRYTVYVQNGDWFESITLLAENRQTASESWSEVLKELGLTKTVNAPIFVIEPTKSKQLIP